MDQDELSGRMLGEFVIRERIGEGGFGAVYRCEQPSLGREAVVKVLHQQMRDRDVIVQRFTREAQLASKLDHPYAAHIYAFGVENDDGLFWIAMEMVKGTTLDRWLRDHGALSLDQFVPFFERVAEVVQTAHERGIVHRDLKPSNIMVIERAGRLLPKLLDFGIAKVFDSNPVAKARRKARATAATGGLPLAPTLAGKLVVDERAARPETLTGDHPVPQREAEPLPDSVELTDADAALGSPPYMAPEQWLEPALVGPRADLYALGIVAYEALSGGRPFIAPTVAAFADQHCNRPVPSLGPQFSTKVDRFFERALAKRPEDRPANALELAAELRIAAEIDAGSVELPRLDEIVRNAWLSDAPQPLAEAVAEVDSARNVHQARDAARELLRAIVRHLLAIALAAHAQVRETQREDVALHDLLRTLPRRELEEDERISLISMLCKPFDQRSGAYPIPELVELCRSEDELFETLHALIHASDTSGSEDIVRSHLVRLLPALSRLMRACAFVLDNTLVVAHKGVAERWNGLRRLRRTVVAVSGELVEGQPVLVDRSGQQVMQLWPVVQVHAPSAGAAVEIFELDGNGRRGARLVSTPTGFEHQDPTVWDWLAEHVIGEAEQTQEKKEHERTPFLGLHSFSTSDADRFVGRERDIDALVNRLRVGALQVVVGASGAGKSSFVHAGVVPSLANYRTISFRPGAQPLAQLAAKLPVASLAPADLRPVLESAPTAAAALVAHAAAPDGVVIVVDQLEELFTLCQEPTQRHQFAAVIAQLAASTDAPIRVICTVRDDFLMQVQSLPALTAILSPALFLLGNPSRTDLIRTVVEPARRAGYEMSDPTLAADMVAEVVERPGALALLSFTAAQLWELRDRRFRQLTRKAYDAMGGVGGALGRHAEGVFTALTSEDQGIARETFRQLVTAEGTRAVVTQAELQERLGHANADTVVTTLVAARLLATHDDQGQSTIELTHEALIEAWPRLSQWAREDVDATRLREQLRAAAKQWHERSRARGMLWRDELLDELERWRKRAGGHGLTDVEVAFADHSVTERRRRTRLRRSAAIGTFMALAAAVIVLLQLTHEARAQRELAQQRRMASYVDQGSHALLDGRFAEATLYLQAAAKLGDRSHSLAFMRDRALRPVNAERHRLPAIDGRAMAIAYSSDGRKLATADDGGVRVWDAASGQLLISVPDKQVALHVEFARANELLVAVADASVNVTDTASGRPIRSIGEDVWAASVAPDARTVATVNSAGDTLAIWNLDDGRRLESIALTSGGEPILEFSRNGQWVAASAGTELVICAANDWRIQTRISLTAIAGFAFDPSAEQIATATVTGDLQILDVRTGATIHSLVEKGEQLDHVAYSPDGTWLVATSRDGHARVWNPRSGKLTATFGDHHGKIRWAEFDPTSRLLVTAGDDGMVVIADAATSHRIAWFETLKPAVMARFSPDSRSIAAASLDGNSRIWTIDDAYRRWATPEHGRPCGRVTASQELGRFIPVVCPGEPIEIWDSEKGSILTHVPAKGSVVVAIAADGSQLAVGAENLTTIYALPSGVVSGTIQHTAQVVSVAISNDGRKVASAAADGSVLVSSEGNTQSVPSDPEIRALAFVPDGHALVIAGRRLRRYDFRTNGIDLDFPHMWENEATYVDAIRFSPDGRYMLEYTTAYARPLEPDLWDLASPREVQRLVGAGAVFSAHFIDEGHTIITASGDGAVRLWSAPTGTLETSLYVPGGQFLVDAAVDTTGELVIAGGSDGTLRFWDRASRKPVWVLRVHRNAVVGLRAAGTHLVTRGWNGDLASWELAEGAWSLQRVEELLRCLPLRLDEDTSVVVEQRPAC